jgi:hypothetical protein
MGRERGGVSFEFRMLLVCVFVTGAMLNADGYGRPTPVRPLQSKANQHWPCLLWLVFREFAESYPSYQNTIAMVPCSTLLLDAVNNSWFKLPVLTSQSIRGGEAGRARVCAAIKVTAT